MVFIARCPARQASKRSGLSAWSSCPVRCHPSQTPLTCAHVFKLFCRHHVRTHVKAASFCMCFQKQLRCLLWHFMLWPTNKTTAGNCEPPGRLERHRIPNRMDFYNIWESLITFWNITWHVYYHISSKKSMVTKNIKKHQRYIYTFNIKQHICFGQNWWFLTKKSSPCPSLRSQ